MIHSNPNGRYTSNGNHKKRYFIWQCGMISRGVCRNFTTTFIENDNCYSSKPTVGCFQSNSNCFFAGKSLQTVLAIGKICMCKHSCVISCRTPLSRPCLSDRNAVLRMARLLSQLKGFVTRDRLFQITFSLNIKCFPVVAEPATHRF